MPVIENGGITANLPSIEDDSATRGYESPIVLSSTIMLHEPIEKAGVILKIARFHKLSERPGIQE